MAPLLVLVGMFIAFTARWGWIAGMGDYGCTHELGMRVLKRQVPYHLVGSRLETCPYSMWTLTRRASRSAS